MSRTLVSLALLIGLAGSPLAADAVAQGRGKGQDKGKKQKSDPPGKGARNQPPGQHAGKGQGAKPPGQHPGKGRAQKGKPKNKKKGCGADLSSVLDALRQFHTGKGLKTVERVMRDHYTRNHAGQTCHCTCGHTQTAGGKVKGNNGVGNGIDPQPPGNPRVNDGPGTGPGNPGNKKGKGAGPGGRGRGKGKRGS